MISPSPDIVLKIGTRSRGRIAVEFWRAGFVNVWAPTGGITPRRGTAEENVAAVQPTKDHVRTRTDKAGTSWLLLGTGAFENGRIVRHNIPLDFESMQRVENHLRDEVANERPARR
jgi:hypothetical protein